MSGAGLLNRQTIAWALYDWGNSAFALSVLAVLFPLYLGAFWSAGDPGPVVTSRLSFATAIASIIVAMIAPVIGAMADRGGSRKYMLSFFTLLGVVSTASLSLVEQGGWIWALALFGMASIGYYSAAVFYDSLIMNVCEPNHYSLVSSLGLSLGYFGGAILLTLHVFMLRSPESYGFTDTDGVFRFSFVSVGVWWLVCLVPLLIYVREEQAESGIASGRLTAAYGALKDTFLKIRLYKDTFKFLVAYWLYIGGLFTVIFMAVNFGQRKGFAAQDLVMALLITNFV